MERLPIAVSLTRVSPFIPEIVVPKFKYKKVNRLIGTRLVNYRKSEIK